MEGLNKFSKPSPRPWRQMAGKPRRILDADGQMVCMVSGVNADANADLILQTVNSCFELKRVFHLCDLEAIIAGSPEEFTRYILNEVQAATKRWAELTPEKRAAYAEYNQFADDHSNAVLVTPDGPWTQSYQKHLRNLHNLDATPLPDAFLPQNQEP